MKKTLISVIAIVLTCFCLIGTTFAWLVTKSDPVVNTFTSGNINISLSKQTATNHKIVPGATLTEKPQATVEADSEDCWLFVKIEKTANFDTFLAYEIAEGWTQLGENTGVYYLQVLTSTEDQTFGILKGDVINAKTEPTKEMYDSINSDNYPTLTFTAYAVQLLGFASADSAWEEAKNLVQQ